MKLLSSLVVLAIFAVSCGTNTVPPANEDYGPVLVRAKVISSNLNYIVDVNLSHDQSEVYKVGDIIAIDPTTRTISSIGDRTWICQILPKNGRYIDPREYQVELNQDTVEFYDGDRMIGRYIISNNPKQLADSIFLADNL